MVRLLGSGGMGEVYEAFDSQLRGRIAVKTLRGASAVDHKMLEQFRAEVLRSRQITHPNVGRIYDLFTHRNDDGTDMLFFTMELLEGETLSQWLACHDPFRPEAALPLLQQISAALRAAHVAGIVHRDLKPSNIFISRSADGEIRATVTDFGIAAEAGSATEDSFVMLTTTGSSVFAGTPAYMAPEQLLGEPASAATDIYSLGLVTYEMLTGKCPYREKSPLACALKKLAPTDALLPGIEEMPDQWAGAIQRCLSRNQKDRFTDPMDFVASLSGSHESTPPWLSRRFLVFASVLVLVFGLAVIIAVVKGWLPLNVMRAPSIAVLPFDNLSGDPQMVYFSDGVCEELNHALTSYPKLHVAAQNAAFRFRSGAVPATQVAKTLGVDMLLTGSIRRSGNRLRIGTQLIDGATGRQLWSQIYDRDLQQVFAIQAEIIREVASRLSLRGPPPDSETAPTKSSEAYDLYLKGRYQWNIRTREALAKGLEYYDQALRLDSHFALAWTGIAESYSILADYGWVLPVDATPKIRNALDQSLAIAPNSAETLVSLGLFNNVFAWDQAGAERAFQQALSLQPSLYLAHSWYGNYLMHSSRWGEALREAERARKLDPLSLPALVFLGWVRYYRREYDQAADVGRQAVAMNASFPHGHQLLAMSYAAQRKVPEALRESDEAFRLTSDHAVGFRYRAVALSQIPSLEDTARKAAEQVELLSQDRQAGYLAIAYAGLGDRERTYQWIDRGLQLHDSALHMTIISPQLDRFRNDVRFKDLVRQLGYQQ